MDYNEKTLKTEDIYKGNIIKVQNLTVSLPNGKEATRDIVLHPGAAVVVPINEKGELYMVKQFRKPLDMTTLSCQRVNLIQLRKTQNYAQKGS